MKQNGSNQTVSNEPELRLIIIITCITVTDDITGFKSFLMSCFCFFLENNAYSFGRTTIANLKSGSVCFYVCLCVCVRDSMITHRLSS